MAEYTLSLCDIIKDFNLDIKAIAMSTYPIFDETYRDGLNEKIIRHYWSRDIGSETVDLFCFNLASKMSEIMPFYNQMYETLQIKFDPLSTYKLSELTDTEQTMHDKRTVDQAANSTSSSDNKTRATALDGPTVMVSDQGNYMSGKALTESETGGTGASESVEKAAGSAEAQGQSRHDVSGRIGDSAELLRSYRAALINVDMMVVESLGSLFMMVWNMGDSSLRKGYGYVGQPIYPNGYFFGW